MNSAIETTAPQTLRTEQVAVDVPLDRRFPFGKNWLNFSKNLSEQRIQDSVDQISAWLEVPSLEGKTFLDIGCGSGLSSLAAHRLGAQVHSFDFDPNSVLCTQGLKANWPGGTASWTIERGSALDEEYLKSLGLFDVVYSWGVLHHTGQMYRGLDLAGKQVKPGGQLFVSIYNDQGSASVVWKMLKKFYVSTPSPLRPLIVFAYVLFYVVIFQWMLYRVALTTLATCYRILTLNKPWEPIKFYLQDLFSTRIERGMSWWHDVIDWIGGYPFEVATPEEIFDFYRQRGFDLQRLKTVRGGHGCNQFVFRKRQDSNA